MECIRASFVAVSLLLLLTIGKAAVLPGAASSRVLAGHKFKVSLMYDVLTRSCPGRMNRDMMERLRLKQTGTAIQVESKLYNTLADMLIDCQLGSTHTKPPPSTLKPTTKSVTTTLVARDVSSEAPTTKSVTMTSVARDVSSEAPTTKSVTMTSVAQDVSSKTPTTKSVTMTSVAQDVSSETPTQRLTTLSGIVPTSIAKGISECQIAKNFTNEDRKDDEGSDLRIGGPGSGDGYGCDFRKDLQWFRFTGKAGNRMMDTCPERQSCGTFNPYWTDATMPTDVGVATTVKAYGVETDCRSNTIFLQVIRCSDSAHDYIYRQTDQYFPECSVAFCSME